jgi:predicted nuclease of predicted toxin-antitoxin system
LKLKLDENLSRHLKEPLQEMGHDVTTAADEGLLSVPDQVIAAAAKREGRALLTLDLDLADIRKYPPGSHAGILVFRPVSFGPLAVNRFVLDFVGTCNPAAFTACLAVIEPGRVRVRQPEQEKDE